MDKIKRSIVILALLFHFIPAAQNQITTFDFRNTPLSEVLKVFTMQTGRNVVASADIKDQLINLYLENVSVQQALETLCKNDGFWFREKGNVIRVMRLEEYSQGIAFDRNETVRHFKLKFASCVSMAEIIASIYSERIVYQTPKTIESFGHIGTDAYPDIGKELSTSTVSQKKMSLTKTQSNNTTTDLGGIMASQKEIQKAIESIGSLNKDSLLAKGIGTPSAYMTVFLRDNAIIIRSNDEQLIQNIQNLIEKLDTPTRQVLLEMKILEITLGDGFESFVDLSLNPGAVITGDGSRQKSNTGLKEISLVNQGTLASSSFKMAYVNDIISANMELYETENRIKKIGSPLMLCANNASGKFFQGIKASLRKGYQVQTTSNSVGEIISQYVAATTKEEEIGVSLEISPSINEDKTVALKIVAEISTLLQGGGPEIPYVTNGEVHLGATDAVRKTQIQDIIVAKDEHTLALGGLINESNIEYKKQVPFLGKIPFLGFFFRSQEQTKERTEIVFLIRPHIIESPNEGHLITNQLMQRQSMHPFYQDSSENLLQYNDSSNVLETSAPGRKKLRKKNTPQTTEP